MSQLDQLALCMMEHDRGDPRRIQHFLKVHALARLIGRGSSISSWKNMRKSFVDICTVTLFCLFLASNFKRKKLCQSIKLF